MDRKGAWGLNLQKILEETYAWQFVFSEWNLFYWISYFVTDPREIDIVTSEGAQFRSSIACEEGNKEKGFKKEISFIGRVMELEFNCF